VVQCFSAQIPQDTVPPDQTTTINSFNRKPPATSAVVFLPHIRTWVKQNSEPNVSQDNYLAWQAMSQAGLAFHHTFAKVAGAKRSKYLVL